MLSQADLKVGNVYRAKKPARAGGFGFVNDRAIVWIGVTQLQYDSPSVPDGRQLPCVTIGKFLDWAGSDVTDEMIGDEWCEWEDYKKKKEASK